MNNSNVKEKNFFTYLQKQFKNNDLVNLNQLYVPNGSSGRINRFYSKEDSLWFSRLKISDNEKLYYFGSYDNLTPKAIMKFSNTSKKSSIKFFNEDVLILVKITDSKIFNEVKNLFSLKYATKDKS